MTSSYNMESLEKRFSLLTIILQYDSQLERHFTVYERMSINQERGSILDKQNAHNWQIKTSNIRDYNVSDKIEQKIQKIKSHIKQLDWKPKEY